MRIMWGGGRRGRSLRLVLAVGIMHVLVLYGSAGAATPTPPVPTPATKVTPPAADALPRAGSGVAITRGTQAVKAQPLTVVKTADGREALADRVIVGYRANTSDTEK